MGARGLEECWTAIRETLQKEAGEAAFDSWLRPLGVVDFADGVLKVAAPTRFIRDRAGDRFGDRLSELWREQPLGVSRVELIVARPAANDQRRVAPENTVRRETPPPPRTPSAAPAQPRTDEKDAAPDFLWSSFDERYTFDSFVVGKSNELAHAAARRVAESDVAPFNPLFLYGGVGLGKTHLMHAIAWEIRNTRPDRKVAYLSAERFMYQFVSALRYRDTISFKQQFRSVDVLLIDDVQFIAGKDSTQEEFFHTFNALIDQNRQIVISADRSPTDLDGVEERIKSRLGWGLVADIHPTDYELRLGVLQSRAETAMLNHPGLQFDAKVLEFIAHRITSNIRELEGALTRLVAHATLVGRPISLEMAQDALQDLLRACDRKLTVEEIQRKISAHYNVRLSDLLSPRRARAIARPRQVAMYLCKHLTSRSLPEIGRKFGGRDHTTVMHAVKKVDELRETDSSFNEEVEMLRRGLES